MQAFLIDIFQNMSYFQWVLFEIIIFLAILVNSQFLIKYVVKSEQ